MSRFHTLLAIAVSALATVATGCQMCDSYPYGPGIHEGPGRSGSILSGTPTEIIETVEEVHTE